MSSAILSIFLLFFNYLVYLKGMKSKFSIVLFVVLFIIGLIGGYYFFISKNYISPVNTAQISPTAIEEKPEELATWTDQSEISFQYPKSVTINPHDEDTQNYAHLELSSLQHPGKMLVWVQDAPVNNLDAWVKLQKGENVVDTTLAGEKAKKLLVVSDSKKTVITTLKDGYLYEIEVYAEDPYWDYVYDIVSQSFTIGKLNSKADTQLNNDADISSNSDAVEEEVLE